MADRHGDEAEQRDHFLDLRSRLRVEPPAALHPFLTPKNMYAGCIPIMNILRNRVLNELPGLAGM